MQGVAIHYEDSDFRELWFDLYHAYVKPGLFYEIGTPEDFEEQRWTHIQSIDEIPERKILFSPEDAHHFPGTLSVYEATPEDLDGVWVFGPDNGKITEWSDEPVIYVPSRHNMYSFQAAVAALAYFHGDSR